jgi:hypothetical protein
MILLLDHAKRKSMPENLKVRMVSKQQQCQGSLPAWLLDLSHTQRTSWQPTQCRQHCCDTSMQDLRCRIGRRTSTCTS